MKNEIHKDITRGFPSTCDTIFLHRDGEMFLRIDVPMGHSAEDVVIEQTDMESGWHPVERKQI